VKEDPLPLQLVLTHLLAVIPSRLDDYRAPSVRQVTDMRLEE
jgi:hypothetical protein